MTGPDPPPLRIQPAHLLRAIEAAETSLNVRQVGYDASPPGCTHPGCGTQQTSTVDGVNGRRCADHPPGYNPRHYAELSRNGLGLAAYIRTVLRLLTGLLRAANPR